MLFLRRALFLLFALIYVVFCPLLIGYALGYLFKPGAGPKNEIVETGLISISTQPPGASVFVGRKLFPEKTPALLRDLLPDDYSIRLVLPGYQAWEEKVRVEPGKAAAFEKILLLPERWQPRTLDSEPAEDLILLPGTRRWLLRRGPRARDLFLYSTDKENEPVPLGEPLSLWASWRVTAVFTRAESRAFVVCVQNGGRRAALWIAAGDKPEVEDLTPVLPMVRGKPDALEWDPSQPKQIFLLQDGRLIRADRASKTFRPQTDSFVRGVGCGQGQVYWLESDGRLYRAKSEKETPEPVIRDPRLGQALFGPTGAFKIFPLSRQRIFFLGERGELVSNQLPYPLIPAGVLGFQVDESGERVLVWSKRRIGLLDFSAAAEEREFFRQGPILRWVYQQGRDIRQAFWVHQASHVLFRDGNRLFLLDLESPISKKPEFLIRVKRAATVGYFEESGRLYYLDEPAGNLAVLSLLSLPEAPE